MQMAIYIFKSPVNKPVDKNKLENFRFEFY